MLRVVVISQRAMLRRGLAIRLGELDGVEALEAGGCMDRVARRVGDIGADWFLVDADLCETDAFAMIDQLRNCWSSARIGLLLMEIRDVAIARGKALKADGVVTGFESTDVFSKMFASVNRMTSYSDKVSARLDRGLIATSRRKNCLASVPLSMRECEVLNYLASGLTVCEAAAKMGLSERTVDNHKSRIVKRLGVCGASELVRYAIRHGIVSR